MFVTAFAGFSGALILLIQSDTGFKIKTACLYGNQKQTQVSFFSKIWYRKIMLKLSSALIKHSFCYNIELEEMTSTRKGCSCFIIDLNDAFLKSCDQESVWLRSLWRYFSSFCIKLQLSFSISHWCGVLILGNRKMKGFLKFYLKNPSVRSGHPFWHVYQPDALKQNQMLWMSHISTPLLLWCCWWSNGFC